MMMAIAFRVMNNAQTTTTQLKTISLGGDFKIVQYVIII